jgi:hypothetical protein
MLRSHVGLTAALVIGFASLATADTRTIDRTLPLSSTGTVSLDAHNGRIEVRTWDRAEVEIRVLIDWPGVPASSSRFRDAMVDIDGSADRVSIRWNPAEFSLWRRWSLFERGWSGPEVSCRITAPTQARLDISTHNARLDIRDVSGAVRIDTHNGVVELANLAGPLALRMHNGTAQVDFASFVADSRISTHNGRIDVALPSTSRFDFYSEGHNMALASDFPLATWTSSYGRRRDADVRASIAGGGPDLRVSTHNGRVRLRSK